MPYFSSTPTYFGPNKDISPLALPVTLYRTPLHIFNLAKMSVS